MGTWGTGLYDDDIASDLKPLMVTMLSLPIPIAEIRAKLAALHQEPDDVALSLLLADQLERRGLYDADIYQDALSVIEGGADVARMRNLGMVEADLRQREKVLAKLADRLRNPRKEKPRKTLSKPKPCPVAQGDVLTFPLGLDGIGSRDRYYAMNPYYSEATRKRASFERVGWGAAVVDEVRYELDFLPWVQMRMVQMLFETKPGVGDVEARLNEAKFGIGTLSQGHFKRMEIEVIGQTSAIKPDLQPGPGELNGPQAAINDISISNLFHVSKDR